MTILDVSIPFLGRFTVDDELNLQDYSLLPTTTEQEINLIQVYLKRKSGVGVTPQEALLSTLASIYGMPPEHATWHLVKDTGVLIDDVLP